MEAGGDGFTFVEGQKIVDVTLPEAMDGSGELTYSLMPSVPGLALHETTRVLSGTPTAAGTHPVTYEAKTAGWADHCSETDHHGGEFVHGHVADHSRLVGRRR